MKPVLDKLGTTKEDIEEASRDSINLPTWAYNIGYRLEGEGGTYDDLYLCKDGRVVRLEAIPNIFELEKLLAEVESQKTM